VLSESSLVDQSPLDKVISPICMSNEQTLTGLLKAPTSCPISSIDYEASTQTYRLDPESVCFRAQFQGSPNS